MSARAIHRAPDIYWIMANVEQQKSIWILFEIAISLRGHWIYLPIGTSVRERHTHG